MVVQPESVLSALQVACVPETTRCLVGFARHSLGHSTALLGQFYGDLPNVTEVSDILGACLTPGALVPDELDRAMVSAEDVLLDEGLGTTACLLALWSDGRHLHGMGAGQSTAWIFRPDMAEDAIDLAMDIPRKPFLGGGIVPHQFGPYAVRAGDVFVAGGSGLWRDLGSVATRAIVAGYMIQGTPEKIAQAVARACFANSGEEISIATAWAKNSQSLPNPWMTA